MIEKTATLCLVLLLVSLSLPLVEQFDRPRGENLGLLDLWAIEAKEAHLDRVVLAQRRFFELRNAKLVPLKVGALDLLTATQELYFEAEDLRKVFRYDQLLPDEGVKRGLAAHLVSAVRYQAAAAGAAPGLALRLAELEQELAMIPDMSDDL
jgi:hypothetical protein